MELTRNDFKAVLKKFEHNSNLKLKPFVRAGISQIVNAKMKYARNIDTGDIVAICDTTFLKNGKSGYLLTVHGLYSSEFDGKAILFDQLQTVTHKSEKIIVTYSNGKSENFPAAQRGNEICELIREVMLLKGTDITKSSAAKETPAVPKAQKKSAPSQAVQKPEAKNVPAEKKTVTKKKTAPANDSLHAEVLKVQEETNEAFRKSSKETAVKSTDTAPKNADVPESVRSKKVMSKTEAEAAQAKLDRDLDELDLFFDEPPETKTENVKRQQPKEPDKHRKLSDKPAESPLETTAKDTAFVKSETHNNEKIASDILQELEKAVKDGNTELVRTLTALYDATIYLNQLEADHAMFAGAEAYKKGDAALAIQKWEKASELGKAECARFLAILYRENKLVPCDNTLSNQWHRRYADLESDPQKLLDTIKLLNRLAKTLDDYQCSAYCTAKLAALDNTQHDVIRLVSEQLMAASKELKDWEYCMEYAKQLIKAGNFYGIPMLNGSAWNHYYTRKIETSNENVAEYFDYVDFMSKFNQKKIQKKSCTMLEECAEAGVSGAAFTLFQIYSLGLGVRADKEAAAYWASKLKVRDEVIFGMYHDSSKWDHAPIYWTVLAREKNRILLLANDILDVAPYHPKEKAVDWESCELRKWLNLTFIDKAFPSEAQKLIASTVNKNPGNKKYGIPDGKDTIDRIFLLSAEEVETYFDTFEAGWDDVKCVVMDPLANAPLSSYVKDKMHYYTPPERNKPKLDKHKITPWLLRTPGENQKKCACMHQNQFVFYRNGISESHGIRPAMWIDLDVSKF